MYPKELKYSKEHEWVRVAGNLATIGITHHAQNALGDIVYTELPKIGTTFKAMQEFGVVESVKTVSTLFCPVSGEVTEINSDLSSKPEVVNSDPYNKGWMIKIKMTDKNELNALMSADQYQALIAK